MMRCLLVGVWLVGLCLAGGCGESDDPAGPAWTPSAAQLDALGAEQDVDRFQLRPPKHFKFVPQKLQPGEVAGASWISATPVVGHGSILGVGVSHTPELPLKVHLDGALGLRKRMPEWKQSETEAGSIQGKAFVRVYWSGLDKGSAVRGFVYVARDGGHLIEIHGIMGESHYETSLPLLEASVLTFRKR